MAKRHVSRIGDLESLFLRLEELVLANSGEDEFEEVFKLIIAKLWDEKSGSGLFRIHPSEAATARAISELLRQANKEWPGILEEITPRLTPEHLSVCVGALFRHSLSSEGLDVMDSFFEFMVSKAMKGAKGQYFTPRHVVEFCVRMLAPKPTETVVDPACGSAGFLLHTLSFVRPRLKLAEIRNYCETRLWGFDMDARAVRVAKALMVLAGDGSSNIVRLNSLLQPSMSDLFASENSILTIEDVTRSRLRRHKGFDVVLTNPPFAGEVREKQVLNAYAVSADRSRIERDVLFVERCIQLLRPGGRMAIVLPHNKFAAESFASLRKWLIDRSQILAVIGLGRNTFLPHTHQKASILFVRKNNEDEQPLRDYKIFFAISEKDGKNSKGQYVTRNKRSMSLWDRVDHDLGDIEANFKEFCSAERVTI